MRPFPGFSGCTAVSCSSRDPAPSYPRHGPPGLCTEAVQSVQSGSAPGETREGPHLIPHSLVTLPPSSGAPFLGRYSTSGV